MTRPISHVFVFFFVIFLLAGCGGQHSTAPVTDRSGKPVRSGEKWVTVRKGDTLFSISFAHGRSHLTVAKLNVLNHLTRYTRDSESR